MANDHESMDLNLHGVPRSLVNRAKSRAALVGLTLKQWIVVLIQAALASDDTLTSKADDGDPSPSPPEGRHE